jgi:hypothetical protein
VVGVGEVRGIDLGLADEELLLVGLEGLPALELVVGPGGELCVPGDDSEPLLTSPVEASWFSPEADCRGAD